MECFEDLVGIKNTCETPVSKSGLWLQNLQGFSLKLADSAVSEEYLSGQKLIKEKYIHAQNAIVANFRAQFQDKIKANSVIDNETVGYFPERLKLIALNNTYLKGIKIEIRNYAYFEVFISQIGLLLKDAVTGTPIYVYDLFTGKLLDTFELTTVAGQAAYINVNKAYPTKNQRLSLFICYDAGVSDSYETNITKTSIGCSSCSTGSYNNRYAIVSGIKIDKSVQKVLGNSSATSGTSGLTVDYSISCNLDNLLCSVAGKFAWPLMYKWGAEIMAELQYSRRLNSIITIDKEMNERLRQEYENEYMSSMSALMNNMQMPNDICFSCNSRITKNVVIP